jgi:hypothetical protein
MGVAAVVLTSMEYLRDVIFTVSITEKVKRLVAASATRHELQGSHTVGLSPAGQARNVRQVRLGGRVASDPD